VILVNLTCGRNPWKRASTEDTTFRAYLKDPEFLRTILPVSPELNSILRRIFECDPVKRITIPELRQLILDCPMFTTTTPRKPGSVEDIPPYANYCPYPPAFPAELLNAQYSDSAVSDTSLTTDDTISSVSSGSDFSGDVQADNFTHVDPQAGLDYWGSPILLTDIAEKSMVPTQLADTYVTAY
jgi:hypothetical protein